MSRYSKYLTLLEIFIHIELLSPGEQGWINFHVFLLMFLKILDHSSVVPDLNKLQKITHLTFNYRLGPTYHAMTKVIPARPAPSAQQKLLRSPLSHAYLSLSITLFLYPPFHYLPQNQR